MGIATLALIMALTGGANGFLFGSSDKDKDPGVDEETIRQSVSGLFNQTTPLKCMRETGEIRYVEAKEEYYMFTALDKGAEIDEDQKECFMMYAFGAGPVYSPVDREGWASAFGTPALSDELRRQFILKKAEKCLYNEEATKTWKMLDQHPWKWQQSFNVSALCICERDFCNDLSNGYSPHLNKMLADWKKNAAVRVSGTYILLLAIIGFLLTR